MKLFGSSNGGKWASKDSRTANEAPARQRESREQEDFLPFQDEPIMRTAPRSQEPEDLSGDLPFAVRGQRTERTEAPAQRQRAERADAPLQRERAERSAIPAQAVVPVRRENAWGKGLLLVTGSLLLLLVTIFAVGQNLSLWI